MSDFIEPRNLIPLLPAVRDMLASETHRLHHAVWHDVRGQWRNLSEGKRDSIRALGWQPGHDVERPAVKRGAPIVDNGSGEDFLFMHREMIGMVHEIYDAQGMPRLAGWGAVPPPGGNPALGFDVPPNWAQDHQPTMRRLAALKTDEYFWTAMRGWDRQFKNAAYLSTLSLGALGATLEYTVHNDMHMRWSSVPRDPSTGDPVPNGRLPTDFDSKWLDPAYDFLGEFYSSHVNPVFWSLHGWVDDRIEDWFAAHDVAHPGEVERVVLDGIQWFKPGRWVSDEKPWVRPEMQGGGHGGHHGGHGETHDLDPEQMREVIRTLYAPETELHGFGAPDTVAPARNTWFLT